MKFQLPPNAFPPLDLSPEEEQDLIEQADFVIEETIAASDAFIAQGKVVREDEWKLFRSKEGVQVYRQRGSHDGTKRVFPGADASRVYSTYRSMSKTAAGGGEWRVAEIDSSLKNATTMETSPTHSTASSSMWIDSIKPMHVPAVLAVGSMEGTVEDVMYGVFADDDASWRWKSSHISDHLDDAHVLARIRGPTKEDPFRFIGVKWFTKEHPSALQHIVKRRDFLVVEAMGMTLDTTGTTPVGYFLTHSVDIPRIPVLSSLGILRGKASVCFIIRQATPTTVDIFANCFSDPQGELMETLSIRLVSESLFAVTRIVDFAYIKKLRWLMLNRKQAARIGDTRDESTCNTCRKSARRLSNFLQGCQSCQVCKETICSKCAVVKDVTVDITVEGAKQKALTFCIKCVLQAKTLPAIQVGLENVKPQIENPPPRTRSISSTREKKQFMLYTPSSRRQQESSGANE